MSRRLTDLCEVVITAPDRDVARRSSPGHWSSSGLRPRGHHQPSAPSTGGRAPSKTAPRPASPCTPGRPWSSASSSRPTAGTLTRCPAWSLLPIIDGEPGLPRSGSATPPASRRMTHRSRLAHFVIDVDDLDQAVTFWAAALDATEEPIQSRKPSGLPTPTAARLRHPHPAAAHRRPQGRARSACTSTSRPTTSRPRSDASKPLGATRYDHQQERGYDFWVLRDPWGNEFCVLQTNFADLLAQRQPWPDRMTGTACTVDNGLFGTVGGVALG